MKKLIILVLALVGLQGSAYANLLSDPGFDSQAVGEISLNTTPWLGSGINGGAWITDTKFQSSSHSAVLFINGWVGGRAEVAQIKSSGILGGGLYNISASFLRDANIYTAQAGFKVDWLNESGATLSSSISTARFDNSYGANIWHAVSDQFAAHPSAVGAKYMIIYIRGVGTDPGDIWIDNANFTPVPEPTSLFLFATGLVSLIAFGRVKKMK